MSKPFFLCIISFETTSRKNVYLAFYRFYIVSRIVTISIDDTYPVYYMRHSEPMQNPDTKIILNYGFSEGNSTPLYFGNLTANPTRHNEKMSKVVRVNYLACPHHASLILYTLLYVHLKNWHLYWMRLATFEVNPSLLTLSVWCPLKGRIYLNKPAAFHCRFV